MGNKMAKEGHEKIIHVIRGIMRRKLSIQIKGKEE